MTFNFYINSHFNKKNRIGGFAYDFTITANSYTEDFYGGLRKIENGFNPYYCESYAILYCLRLAADVIVSNKREDKEEVIIIIHTSNKRAFNRITKEWKNKERLKNFVRIDPWDKIRTEMFYADDIISSFVVPSEKGMVALKGAAIRATLSN